MHQKTQLGKIAEIQAGLVTKTAGEGNAVPVVTMASLAGMRAGSLSSADLPLVGEDAAMQENLYKLRDGDVLVPSRTTEDYLEPAFVMGTGVEGRVFNATLLRVRGDERCVDQWWLYGYLGSDVGKAKMLQGSQSGTSQLSLSAKSLALMEVEVPPMNVQVKIGRLIKSAHDAQRNAIEAAELRLRLAYAAAFQDDRNF